MGEAETSSRRYDGFNGAPIRFLRRMSARFVTPSTATATGFAARSTRTRRTPTASWRPDMLVRHYEWAGFDVLAITDHWVRTVERSTKKLLVIPSAELNAQAGGPEHDAHVLALGLDADPELPRGAVRARSRRSCAGSRERRRPLSRAHVLERAAHRPVGGLRGARRDRGLERGLRARDRPRRLVAALGRGARARAAPVRARDRRLAPSRLRQRLRLDDGRARRSAPRRPCSTRCARASSTARPGRRSTSSR